MRCAGLYSVNRSLPKRGQEQRGGLSHGAGDCQHGSGDDPGQCGWDTDPHHRLAPRGAERQAPFAQLVGHQSKHLLSRPGHQRQHDDRECQRSSKAGEAEPGYPDRVDECAGDDRRNPNQYVIEEADRVGESSSPVLDQVDRGADSERDRNQRCDTDDDRGSRRCRYRTHRRRQPGLPGGVWVRKPRFNAPTPWMAT